MGWIVANISTVGNKYMIDTVSNFELHCTKIIKISATYVSPLNHNINKRNVAHKTFIHEHVD